MKKTYIIEKSCFMLEYEAAIRDLEFSPKFIYLTKEKKDKLEQDSLSNLANIYKLLSLYDGPKRTEIRESRMNQPL